MERALSAVQYIKVARALPIVVLALSSIALGEPLPGGRTAEVRVAPEPPLPVRGPRFAPVTIDVWLTLPATTVMAKTEPLLRRQLAAGDVRLVYHLGGSEQAPSLQCLEALAEALREDRFFPLLDALIERGLDPRQPAIDEIARLAVDAGLDEETLRAALADRRHRDRASRWIVESRAAGHGNEILINGAQQSLQPTPNDLAQAIATQRKRARDLADEGVPLTLLYERMTRDEALFGADPSRRRRVSIDLAGAPSRGPEVAPVTIVLFSSFACGPCKRLHETLKRVDERFPGRIRFVWKNLPASVPAAMTAAQFAEAAAARNGFWAMYDHALQAPLRVYGLGPTELEAATRASGLDGAAIQREVAADGWRSAVQRDVDEARKLEITQPGTSVVNGLVLPPPPALGYEQYEAVVEHELEAGVLERLAGDRAPPRPPRSTE